MPRRPIVPIDPEKEPEKWNEHYEKAKKHLLREVYRYTKTYDLPVQTKMIRMHLSHDLRVLGLRLTEFLYEVDKEGDIVLHSLPKTGKPVILTPELHKMIESGGPFNLINYLGKYENGDFEFKPYTPEEVEEARKAYVAQKEKTEKEPIGDPEFMKDSNC